MSRRTPQAVVFDLDGVLIDSARIHAHAWKEAFDRFFAHLEVDDELDEVIDYRAHLDGRPRYEGVSTLLASRDIELAKGDPGDEPGFHSQAALGNLKNEIFHELLETEEVEVLYGAETLLAALSAQGVPIAVVSSSRNARAVIPEALESHVDVFLGGDDLAEMGIRGKPDPRMFVEGARRLGVDPAQAAVVEDAGVGVEAGRRGGFTIVIGVDPEGPAHLRQWGADTVISSVGALPEQIEAWTELLPEPQPALDSLETIESILDRPAIFLDYDGTLTPIVDDPELADIGEEERAVLRKLTETLPVAVISGRGLDDLMSHVRVDGLIYSGSHGFEIEMADGERFEKEDIGEAADDLDNAEKRLQPEVKDLDGVFIERKPYAIAVHTRRAASGEIREAAIRLAEETAAGLDHLVIRGGKEIVELRPAVDWDKGAALGHLLDVMGGSPTPMYIGDDDTDEDAFRAVRQFSGVGVLVGESAGADTWADFRLSGPDQTYELLTRLIG